MIQKSHNRKKVLLISLILLISALLLFFGLIGCNKEQSKDSDASMSEAEQKIAELLKGKLNDYQIVRAESMDKTELRILLSFANVLKNNGAEDLRIVSDYEKAAPVIDNEIIVGETTRKDSVYFAGSGVVLENEGYTVAIVENRLIFEYTDQKGMTDGLECLLFFCLDADRETISEAYDLSLFERDVKRYSFDNFSLKNQLTKDTRLIAGKEMLFIGTADPNAEVTLQLTNGLNVVTEADTLTDANGTWKASIVPDKSANALVVRIDGKLAEKYDDITFVDSVLKAPSNGMKVYINDAETDVYETEAGYQVISSLQNKEQTSMRIKIVRDQKIYGCDIRPLSKGIEADISGNSVSFTVTEFPIKLSVEFDNFNEDNTDSVQLFLYEYEEFTPDLKSRELMYFAPGEYWIDNTFAIPSDTTMYLAEGAVLHARFSTKNAENITVEGRGIIDTYSFKTETNMMVFENCSNVLLKDYLLTGPRKWMTVLTNSDNCVVDCVNIVGTEINSDGIDIVGSKNITVKDCFLRTNDDCIAIKSWGNDVKNINISGCVLWDQEYGNAMEIGYETRCTSISDVKFEDNDIIHVEKGACMSIHLGDRAKVSNIYYEDVRIEDANGKLVDFFIRETQYTKDDERGSITNVDIENIHILSDHLGRISLEGYDSEHTVSDITISNITYNGIELEANMLTVDKNSYTYDITYNGNNIS